MPRPCTCGKATISRKHPKEDCYLCWKFLNREQYFRGWGGEGPFLGQKVRRRKAKKKDEVNCCGEKIPNGPPSTIAVNYP